MTHTTPPFHHLIKPAIRTCTTTLLLTSLLTPLSSQPPWQPQQQTPHVFFSIQLKDLRTREPIPAATLQITSPADSSLRRTTFSDDNGTAELTVPTHIPLTLSISHPAYKDTLLAIEPLHDHTFWGVLLLHPTTQQLQTITIKAQRTRVNFDKKEYIVTERMRRRATTATDILKELPDIQYDPFQDQILVRGKTNILYLVNGVEKPPEYVKNISPQRILRIEIYRNPTGRYALQGYDAVINIILRDDYIGWELTTGGQAAFSTNWQQAPAPLPYMFSFLRTAFIRYRTTFRFVFYNWKYHGYAHDNDALNYNTTPLWIQQPLAIFPQGFNALSKGWGFSLYAGMDWIPSTQHQIAIDSRFSSVFIPYSTQRAYTVQDTPSTLHIYARNDNTPRTYQITFTHTWKYTRDYQLQTAISYAFSQTTTYIRYEEQNLFTIEQIQQSWGPTGKAYWEWNGTLAHNKLHLLMGTLLETTKQTTRLTTSFNLQPSETTPEFHYTLTTLKPYAYLTWRIAQKLKLRTGTGIQTIWFTTNNTPQPTLLFIEPAADINWQPHKLFTIVLSYRMDIENPSIAQMLTTAITQNRYIRQMGNPNLKPYAHHSIQLDANALSGLLSLTPFYEWSTNAIDQIWIPYNQDSIVAMPIQGVHYQNWGTEFSIPIPLYKRSLILMVYGELTTTRLAYDTLTNQISRFSGFIALIYHNERHKFSTGFASMNFVVKNPLLQGYTMQLGSHPPDFYGFFLRKQFWKNRGSATLYLTFPWQIPPIDYTLTTELSSAQWHRLHQRYYPAMRYLAGFMLRFNFAQGRTIHHKKQPDNQPQPQGFPMF